ncbi:MAG: type III polyketide synthase [Bauldia sp.]
MTTNPALLGLATAVPEHCLATDDLVRAGHTVFAERGEDFAFFAPMFRNTGIEKRYSPVPLTWFLEPQDWPSRTRAFLDAASALFRRTATAALAEAGVGAGAIDTIVTVSSTGVATPSLEARLLTELGFRADVQRVPVFGLGCAGGVTGLSLATRLARANPGGHVLLVVIELCTLAFRLDDFSARNMVATALFADGAAAAVLGPAGANARLSLGESYEHTWPDTVDIMGWEMDPVGFGVILSRSIPDFVGTHMRPTVIGALAKGGRRLEDFAHLVFHPGGGKVLDALEAAFGFAPGQLKHERAVLADYGNMSAPTALFILERALAAGASGPGLMAALGPGFTASLLTYEVAR